MLVKRAARCSAHAKCAKHCTYSLHIYWGSGDDFPHFSASEIRDDAAHGRECPTPLFQWVEVTCGPRNVVWGLGREVWGGRRRE